MKYASSIPSRTILLIAISVMSSFSHAQDPLHHTKWKTIDESTKQAKSIVEFTEVNGKLSAKVIEKLAGSTIDKCSKCTNELKDKPLVGLPIIHHLTPQGNNQYANGKILDPKTGKIYNLKATLAEDGKTLQLRGFIGISALGRSQTWQREF